MSPGLLVSMGNGTRTRSRGDISSEPDLALQQLLSPEPRSARLVLRLNTKPTSDWVVCPRSSFSLEPRKLGGKMKTSFCRPSAHLPPGPHHPRSTSRTQRIWTVCSGFLSPAPVPAQGLWSAANPAAATPPCGPRVECFLCGRTTTFSQPFLPAISPPGKRWQRLPRGSSTNPSTPHTLQPGQRGSGVSSDL